MTDKKDFSKKSITISIILFLVSSSLFCQNYKIDYYGIVSTEIDANMSKMVSDLYYTQLTEINNFSVTDKRTAENLSERPDSSIFVNDKLSFFTIIQKETKSDKWLTTYYVVDKTKNEEHSKIKTYDSFYKILMESKEVLKETIKQLIENDKSASKITNTTKEQQPRSTKAIVSTEELSGTWMGEENINKIVIMRGGRGFVIFNNGASMNISIELLGNDNNKKVIVMQKGNSNASFYPELQRTVALNAAISANPIKWTLSFSDQNTLTGTKETLLPDGDSYTEGHISVVWTKIN